MLKKILAKKKNLNIVTCKNTWYKTFEIPIVTHQD